ncbi:hypothetical protein H0A36_15705 [Endozoicomonas sp. SM1973]|uniref:Leucine-rich repeat domain-containing protein n=1 Tax=Spartinivicinus marinus TaxID=2994442 RepID=A0A853I703_9GAMM|nr:hypothetical protein [Spartinivicinus marinus]MCX4028425.1 hypothetical protein [Spartinivicinus marinus]NYZ67462.1 hypothetical protein [Spartinivicinus marinus]
MNNKSILHFTITITTIFSTLLLTSILSFASTIQKGKFEYVSDLRFKDEYFYRCLAKNDNQVLMKIEAVDCPDMKIMYADEILYLPNLKKLNLADNQIMQLDTSKNKLLEELNLAGNQLSKLNLNDNQKLRLLTLSNNKIRDLNTTKNTLLEEITIENNVLKKINLANNVKLIHIDISSNKLRNLDISKNINLSTLNAINNLITNLTLPELNKFIVLEVNNNPLSKETVETLKGIQLSQGTVRF